MSLESAQRSPRLTSFLIKDILASNEEKNTSETVLYEDSLSSASSHSSALTESELDSPNPFPFSDSCIGFSQTIGGHEEHRVLKDSSESSSEQNPTRARFEPYVSTGKFALGFLQ